MQNNQQLDISLDLRYSVNLNQQADFVLKLIQKHLHWRIFLHSKCDTMKPANYNSKAKFSHTSNTLPSVLFFKIKQ
jgi:hypothetical protein